MELDLGGELVLVTGASGGIGFAIADAFAREGARVIAHFRTHNPERAEELADIVQSEKGKGMLHACDLTSSESVHDLFEKIVQQMGNLPGVIVNNVGVSFDGNRISEISGEDFDQLYRVDLRSCFLVLHELQRRMEVDLSPSERYPVSIVNIASTAGLYGEAGNAAYAAMKAGLLGLGRSAAVELAHLAPGSRVNTVAPGWIVTPMAAALMNDKNALLRAMMTRKIPDLGEPEDVANAVLFLASRLCSRMTTGQVLLVDGGMDERVIWMPNELEPHYAVLRERHPELPE